MTSVEKKATSLEGLTITPDILKLITFKTSLNELSYTAASKALDANIARYFLKAFEVGDEKTVIYGNPLVISAQSQLFADLIDEAVKEVKNDKPLLLAPGLSLQPYPECFVSVWLYINGFTPDSYLASFPHTYEADATVQQLYEVVLKKFKIWDWIKYFGVDQFNLAFTDYISELAYSIIMYMRKLDPKFAAGEAADIKLFPNELKDDIHDIHESLKEYVMEGKLHITSIAQSENVNALFTAILGGKDKFAAKDYINSYAFGYPEEGD